MNEDMRDPSVEGVNGLNGVRANESGTNTVPNSAYLKAALSNLNNPEYIKPYSESGADVIGQDISTYDYDMRNPDEFENIQRSRSERQPEWLKATNAVIGGVATGLATAVQDMSYILDVKGLINYLSNIGEADAKIEENFISEAFKKVADGINSTLPIYEDPKVNGISDQFLRWNTLREGINSIVGFGLAGYGAGAVVKGLQLGAKVLGAGAIASKAASYSNMLSKGIKAASEGVAGIGNAGTAVNSIGAGLLSNYAEGKMMALEFGDKAREELYQSLYDEADFLGVDREQYAAKKMQEKYPTFDDDLTEQMNKFMHQNVMFSLGDMFAVHGIFKGIGTTRNLIKERGLKPFIKSFKEIGSDNLILQGIKEAAEEMGQNALQSEAEYQVKVKNNLLTDEEKLEYNNDTFKRIIDFAFTDQAIVEGLMGFLSGGPQRILMEAASGKYSKHSREAYDKAFQDQQQLIDSYTKNKMVDVLKVDDLKESAIASNDILSYEMAKDSQFGKMMLDAFNNGTTEKLEQSLINISNISEDEAKSLGYDDNYKEEAESRLETLKKAENLWISNNHKINKSDIVQYSMLSNIFSTQLNKLNKSEADLLNEINNQLKTVYNEDAPIINTIKDINNLTEDQELKIVELKEKLNNLEYQKNKLKESLDKSNKMYKASLSNKGETIFMARKASLQVKEINAKKDKLTKSKHGKEIYLKDENGDDIKDNNGNPKKFKYFNKGNKFGQVREYNEKDKGYTTLYKEIESLDELEKLTLANENEEDKQVLNNLEVKEVQKTIDSFEDPDDLIDYINNTIKPNGYGEIDLIRKYALDKYNKLTGDKLEESTLRKSGAKARYVNKYYIKDNKVYEVTRDSNKDTYWLNNIDKNNKRVGKGRKISLKELNDLYEFIPKNELSKYVKLSNSQSQPINDPDTTNNALEVFEKSSKKYLKDFFKSTTGNLIELINNKRSINKRSHQVRFFSFINNNSVSNYKGKVSGVPSELKDIISKELEGTDYDINNVSLLFVTDKDGSMIDINGKKTDDPTKSIFSTIYLPTSTERSDNTKRYAEVNKTNWNRLYPKADSYEKALSLQKADEEKEVAIAKTILEKIKNGESLEVKITGKSIGFDLKELKDDSEQSFTDALNSSLDSLEIHVATKDDIIIKGESIHTISGMIYVVDKNDNIYKGNAKKLNQDKIKLISDLFKLYVNQTVFSKSGKVDKRFNKQRNTITDSDGNGYPRTIFEEIKQYIYFTVNNLDQDGNAINTNKDSLIYFMDDYSIAIGENVYPLFEMNENKVILDEQGKATLNKETEVVLTEFLSKQYHQVKTLINAERLNNKTNKENGKYTELISIDNGEIKTKEHKSYTSYINDNVLYTNIKTNESKIALSDDEAVNIPTKEGQYLKFEYLSKDINKNKTKNKTKVVEKKDQQTDIDDNTFIDKKGVVNLSKYEGKIVNIKYKVTNILTGSFKLFDMNGLVKDGEFTNAVKNEEHTAPSSSGFELLIDMLANGNRMLNSMESIGLSVSETFISEVKKPEVSKLDNNVEGNITVDETSAEKAAKILADRGIKPNQNIGDKSATSNAVQDAMDKIKNRNRKPKRRISLKSKQSENLVEMKKWFNEKFPNIDFNIINEAIKNGVHGEFINGVVNLYTGAEKGTVYHESFHVVFNLFTNENERNRLIAEVINSKDPEIYFDNAKRLYPEYTKEELAEEVMAEMFRDYMIGIENKVPKSNNVFSKIKNFIIDFFKNIWDNITNKKTLDKYFESINKNKFVRLNNSNFNLSNKYKKVKGKDYLFTKDAIDGVHYYFMDYICNQTNYNFEALFSLDNKKSSALITSAYAYAKDNIQQVLNDFINLKTELETISVDFKELGFNSYEEALSALINQYDKQLLNKINNLNYILENFYHNDTNNSIVDCHKEFMKIFSIELNTEGLTEEAINNLEADESERGRDTAENKWGNEIKYNSKLNASKSIKLLLASLPRTTISEDGEYYEREQNSIGLYTNVPFGEVFNILSNEFKNIPTNYGITDIKNKLIDISKTEYSIDGLIDVLGLNDDPSTFTQERMNTLMQFFQTFAKNKNIYQLSYLGALGEFVILDASESTAKSRIKINWANDVNESMYGDLAVLYKKINGEYYYNNNFFAENFKNINAENVDTFLNLIGINLTNYSVGEFKDDIAIERASHILKAIKKGDCKILFNNNNSSDNTGDLNYFIDLELRTTVDKQDNSHYNQDGELVYDTVLNSYWNNIINTIKQFDTYEEMIDELPHLNKNNSSYLTSSILLDKNNFNKLKKLQVIILEGSREIESGIARAFKDLKPVDKMINVINHTLEGNFNMLRPADNSLERFYSFGDLFMSKEDIFSRKYHEVFINYLKDELYRIGDLSGNYSYKNFDKNKKNGVFINTFLKYEDDNNILKSFINQDVYNIKVNGGNWNNLVDSFIEENSDLFKASINSYLEDRVSELKHYLLKNKAIIQASGFILNNSIKQLEDKVSDNDVELLLLNFVVNDIIGITEQHKLFLGDPAFYKTVADEFKRHNGSVGTKKLNNTSNEINEWISSNLKRQDGAESLMSKDELGSPKPIIRTMIFNDIDSYSKDLFHYGKMLDGETFDVLVRKTLKIEGEITEEIYNENKAQIIKAVSKSKLNSASYTNMNEGDGAGYITLDEYREFLFRSGDWTDKLEKLYQWEINDNSKGIVTYLNQQGEEIKITEADIKGTVFNSLKPQYFGPLAEVGFKPSMYKLSLQPLIPSVIKGRTLEKLNKVMMENQIGIATHYSANKGVTTKLAEKYTIRDNEGNFIEETFDQEAALNAEKSNLSVERNYDINNFYNENGEFQLDKYNGNNVDKLLTQDTYYKYWGIQLDTGSKVHHDVTTGTQMMKQVTNGLLSNGEVADRFKDKNKVRSIIDNYIRLNKSRVNLGANNLKRKLGLKLVGDNYLIDNVDYLVQTLMDEAISRNSSDNIIEGIQSIKDGILIDSLINREKIENIMFGLADSMMIKQKRNGRASYQQTSTGFEMNATREYNDGKYCSGDLKFYQNKDGKVTRMEVYMPSYLEGIIDIGEVKDKRLLNLIGFRIPTQGLNSIENIVVKGFLDKNAGDIVVMPTEIVAKAGSDYDIDKLYIYIPNYERDYNGNYNYIEYINDEEKLYDRWLKNERRKELKDIISTDKYMKSINTQINNLYNALTEEYDINNEEFLKDMATSMSELVEGLEPTNSFKASMDDFIKKAKIKFKVNDSTFKRINEINEILSNAYEQSEDNARSKGKYISNFHQLEEERDDLVDGLRIYKKAIDLIFDTRSSWKEAIKEEQSDDLNKLELKRKSRKTRIKNIKESFREEFNSLSLDEKNGLRAVENAITEIQSDIMSMPELYNDLMAPIASDTLKGLAAIVNKLRDNLDTWESKIGMESLIDRTFLTSVAERYMGGKASVGITALFSTFHIAAQQEDLKLHVEQANKLYSENYIEEENLYRLGATINYAGENIPDLLNQWISAAVDAAKEPFMSDLNASPQTLNTILMLTLMGVSSEDIALFMNQPIIRKYVENQNIYESQIAEASKSLEGDDKKYAFKMYKNKLINLTKYSNVKDDLVPVTFTNEMLRLMIDQKQDEMSSDKYKINQNKILDMFIKYQDVAKDLSEAIQGSTWDTNGAGKNLSELFYKAKIAGKHKTDDYVKGYSNMLSRGFLSAYYKNSINISEIFKPFFITLQNNRFLEKMNEMFTTYWRDNESGYTSLTKSKAVKILDKFKTDFITYIVQNRQLKYNNKDYIIGSRIEELFKGENSLPKRLKELRSNPYMLENYPILSILTPIIREQNLNDSILPSGKKLDPLEINVYVDSWKQLHKDMKDFSIDLIHFALLQSGMQNSNMSFIRFIPNEIYSEMVDFILGTEDISEDNYSNYFERFFLANYNDKDVLGKKIEKKSLVPFYSKRSFKPEYASLSKSKRNDLIKKGVNVWGDLEVYNADRVKIDKFFNIKNLRRDNNSITDYYIRPESESQATEKSAIAEEREQISITTQNQEMNNSESIPNFDQDAMNRFDESLSSLKDLGKEFEENCLKG